jgi:hypothetical protein
MDNNANRSWSILNWNVWGLNSVDKYNAIRSKIEESSYLVFCVQQTNPHHFDHSNFRKLAPKCFNKYTFVPSERASGGGGGSWVGTPQPKAYVIHSSKFAITT